MKESTGNGISEGGQRSASPPQLDIGSWVADDKQEKAKSRGPDFERDAAGRGQFPVDERRGGCLVAITLLLVLLALGPMAALGLELKPGGRLGTGNKAAGASRPSLAPPPRLILECSPQPSPLSSTTR